MTEAAKKALYAANAHRQHTVYIYDDMFNLVAFYPSISQFAKMEKAQKNSVIKYLNNKAVWRGYIISRVPLK